MTDIKKIFYVLLLLSLVSCGKNPDTIRIGVAATLSGSSSSFGQHVKNGYVMAADYINSTGGIKGRQVELIIKDDKGDAGVALQVDQQLIDEGVVAILGHYQSSLATKTVPLMNQNRIMMISPTVATTKLKGLDDYFISMNATIDDSATALATYSYEDLSVRKISFIHDRSNPDYSDDYYFNFESEFIDRGGEAVISLPINTREEYSATEIARGVKEQGSGAVVIIADSNNTAIICQHLRKINPTIHLIASGWSFTDSDFIRMGGEALEGMIGITPFHSESPSPRVRKFRMEYRDRFDSSISMADSQAYETALFLFQALEVSTETEHIKKFFSEEKVLDGLDAPILINSKGEILRNLYIHEIRNGEYSLKKTIYPRTE